MRILFICTGNACRSAAAEAVLKKMIADAGIDGIDVASCGTGVPSGLYRDETMCRIAAQHGYDMGGLATPVSDALLSNADVIVVMTLRHRDQITRLLPYDRWQRIVLFNQYCFGEQSDLPDPHFQSEHIYRTCFDRIVAGCSAIINNLKRQ